MGKDLFVGVDLGGTSMTAVIANGNGKVLGESGTATDRTSWKKTVELRLIEAVHSGKMLGRTARYSFSIW